jgi:DNA repair exonuclease SbcCD ATPase subunit
MPDNASPTPNESQLLDVIKQLQGQLAQYDQRLTQQQAQFDELVDAIAEAVQEEEQGEQEEEQQEEQEQEEQQEERPRGGGGGPETEEVASLRRQLGKMSKQMEEMQNIIVQREETASEERELRLASERDALLAQALQESGVLPNAIDAGLKLFRDNIYYDEDRDEFVFVEDKTGVKLPIEEGVKDNMPDYLKASSVKQGGSGGRGSQANVVLEQARQRLGQLEKAARTTGAEADIAAYHAAKKNLASLEKERVGGPPSGGGAPPQQPTPRQPETRPLAAGARSAPSEE